jgi:hypothetical protein
VLCCGVLWCAQEAAEEDSGNIGRALEDADVVLLLVSNTGRLGAAACSASPVLSE